MEEQRILLIIPAFNEAETIEHVVNGLTVNFPQYDYVVVNDGSSDGTGELCMEKGYQVLNLPINLGIGGAVQTGYRYALKYGYDIAVQLDGDGQHDASYVKRLIEPLLAGEADVVIGSRFLRREGFQSSRSRRVGINILSDLIWLCTGKRVRDVTSGFRAVNRKFISIYAEDYPSDYPEPEAIITAVMHRGRVAEVPVVMKEREGGTSSITFRKSVYYMIKVTLAILVKRISYGIRR
ncbi:MAG TPA: glycosyltransferase family 2 protein [Candidatus Merdisoma faecalis]|nr:glycosyltransferase family 2 protein [Candidatus Merdisoma faecalis]